MNTIQINEEELKQLHTLRDQYTEMTFRLGQIKLEQVMLNTQLKRLIELEETIALEYMKAIETEDTLVNDLIEKYGNGELDIETGQILLR